MHIRPLALWASHFCSVMFIDTHGHDEHAITRPAVIFITGHNTSYDDRLSTSPSDSDPQLPAHAGMRACDLTALERRKSQIDPVTPQPTSKIHTPDAIVGRSTRWQCLVFCASLKGHRYSLTVFLTRCPPPAQIVLHNRSGSQNVILALPSSYGLPCRYENTGSFPPDIWAQVPRSAGDVRALAARVATL